MSSATHLMLNCHCTKVVAIPLDQIDHGFLAGWTCQHCGLHMPLSAMVASTEFLAATPEMNAERPRNGVNP